MRILNENGVQCSKPSNIKIQFQPICLSLCGFLASCASASHMRNQQCLFGCLWVCISVCVCLCTSGRCEFDVFFWVECFLYHHHQQTNGRQKKKQKNKNIYILNALIHLLLYLDEHVLYCARHCYGTHRTLLCVSQLALWWCEINWCNTQKVT